MRETTASSGLEEQGALSPNPSFLSCLHRLVCGVLGLLGWEISQTNQHNHEDSSLLRPFCVDGLAVSDISKDLDGFIFRVKQADNTTTLEAPTTPPPKVKIL